MKQGGDPSLLIEGQPLVHAIRITWVQQPLYRHPMRGEALGHFEQGRSAFPGIRMGMMMHRFFQRDPFWLREEQCDQVVFFDQLTHLLLLPFQTVPCSCEGV